MVFSHSSSTTRHRPVRRVLGSSPTGAGARPGPLGAIGLGLSAAVLTLVLASCVGEVPAVPAGDAQLVEGREVYARNCVGCHGVDGRGGTGSKLNEGVVIERFPDPGAQADVVANGRNQMPAFVGKLSDEEIDAVVRFTREGL